MNEKPQSEGELEKLVQLADHDVAMAIDDYEKSDTPYIRRSLIRTIFSSIDAMISASKSMCLDPALMDESDFTSAELLILKEESPELSNNGSAKVRRMRLPTASNIRFTMKMVNKSGFNPREREFKIDGNDWCDFIKAMKVRNRVTHPKKLIDWEVSEGDIKLVIQSWKWFEQKLMEATGLEYLRARFEGIVDGLAKIGASSSKEKSEGS